MGDAGTVLQEHTRLIAYGAPGGSLTALFLRLMWMEEKQVGWSYFLSGGIENITITV